MRIKNHLNLLAEATLSNVMSNLSQRNKSSVAKREELAQIMSKRKKWSTRKTRRRWTPEFKVFVQMKN